MTRLFSRLVDEYLSDTDYGRLQRELLRAPEAGAVIRGSDGVRKLRWAAAGRGKRGGCRVIYYPRRAEGIIWMLTIYPKIVADTIPVHVLKQICREIDHE